MIVRDLRPADGAPVHRLLTSAFPGPAEAKLVEQLRADGDAQIELVAEEAGDIIGHVLFSTMHAPWRALALAPVAVAPHRQRQGIGSALIEAGSERARAAGWEGIFVLGDPSYYGRFGYSVDAATGFTSQYAGPCFALLRLRADLPRRGKVRHAAAFEALG